MAERLCQLADNRLLETIPEAERDAVPARGLVTLRSGGFGPCSSGITTGPRGASLQGSGPSALCLRKRSPKLSQGNLASVAVERRKASAPRGGCFAVTRKPSVARAGLEADWACSLKLPVRSSILRLSALRLPLLGGKRLRAVRSQTSGAKNASRERECLPRSPHPEARAKRASKDEASRYARKKEKGRHAACK